MTVRALCWWLWLVATPLARAAAIDLERVVDAAQDGTGHVWAVAHGELYRTLDGVAWASVGIATPLTRARPERLGAGRDGAILCLWYDDSGGERHAVTEHNGAQSRVLATFTGRLRAANIFGDSSGNVWISDEGDKIYRVPPGGDTASLIAIRTEQFRIWDSGPYSSSHNPVFALEDARKRVWFWSNTLAGGTNSPSLRGVLIFDGEKLEHHETLAGLPDEILSVIENKDADHLWVAVEKNGLYELNVSTLRAERVPHPEPEALRYVQKIFRVDDDWFFVTGQMWERLSGGGAGERSSVLWRLRGGRWTKLLRGIDEQVEYRQSPHRPFLKTQRGLLLGSFGGGAWLIPDDDAKPVRIDWRSGFPLADTNRLFPLSEGRFLGVGTLEGTYAGELAPLLASQPEGKVQTLKTHRSLLQDRRGRIWGVLAPPAEALNEWDGQKWIAHPVPTEVPPEQLDELNLDSRQRIWFITHHIDKPAAIFDPALGTWETFASYGDALQAQLSATTPFRFEQFAFQVATFSTDGRICFRGPRWEVNYFDGKSWRSWRRQDIKRDDNFSLDGPPFFNRAGNLSVNISDETWEFTQERGWRLKGFEPGFGDNAVRKEMTAVSLPAGSVTPPPDEIVRDNQDGYWLTSGRQLYKARSGITVPVFPSDERQPFIDGRSLREALMDTRGNAFLRTAKENGEEYVIVFADEPLPETSIDLADAAADAVTLKFSMKNGQGKPRFIWRIDGEDWSRPTRDSELHLNGLASGQHRVEVVAIDQRLQTDPTAAEAAFEIRIDPAKQISALIEQLADPDFAQRERAVRALARQPEIAAPALRAARQKARHDHRWWIDAALQELERRPLENSR